MTHLYVNYDLKLLRFLFLRFNILLKKVLQNVCRKFKFAQNVKKSNLLLLMY